MKFRRFLYAAIRFRFFSNDCLSGDSNKLSFVDLFLADCFMQLVCEGVEDDNLVPGGLTTLVIDC